VTGLIGGNNLAVEHGIADIEFANQSVAEIVETAQVIALPRNEPEPAVLDIVEGSKPVVFELEHPFRVHRKAASRRWE